VIPLTDRYVYQQGHHYHRMRAAGETLTGALSSRAGVHTHIVMDTRQMGMVMGIPSDSGHQVYTFQARHPQVDTLLIM
jgi:adenosylmethionine-8-amino-7-oxononanoate aminotransferase